MKGAIIYKSKYGSTHDYAEWLSEELELPVIGIDELRKNELDRFDFLLIGTPVYFGKFLLLDWLKKNVRNIWNKKLFLFVVSGTPPQAQGGDKFIRANVPQEIKQGTEIFFLAGRVIHKNLTLRDKLIIGLRALMIKDSKKKKAIRSDLDNVNKENLFPLITAVKKFCSAAITAHA